jgi:bifunctional non-homologous end joining protein LigD
MPLYSRTLPPGFIAPCLPTKAPQSPSGDAWLHEIKHDGFRVIARKVGERVRLYSLLTAAMAGSHGKLISGKGP